MLRGGDETVEGLFGLFHAFLGECTHFRRNLELPIAFDCHDILLLLPGAPVVDTGLN